MINGLIWPLKLPLMRGLLFSAWVPGWPVLHQHDEWVEAGLPKRPAWLTSRFGGNHAKAETGMPILAPAPTFLFIFLTQAKGSFTARGKKHTQPTRSGEPRQEQDNRDKKNKTSNKTLP